jgi:chromosome segregation ATPase
MDDHDETINTLRYATRAGAILTEGSSSNEPDNLDAFMARAAAEAEELKKQLAAATATLRSREGELAEREAELDKVLTATPSLDAEERLAEAEAEKESLLLELDLLHDKLEVNTRPPENK